MLMPDNELNANYLGLTGNVGFGTPGKEFHIEWGATYSIPTISFNFFDISQSVYNKIMEW